MAINKGCYSRLSLFSQEIFPHPSTPVDKTGAYSSSDHFRGTSPFNVQVNFDIPVFEGQIYEDALEKWLNLLEGYFSIHNFS
jgi:hypothetical protein